MELSLLFELKVLLCVLDKNDKLVTYYSDSHTPADVNNYLCNQNVMKEYFSNSEVNLFNKKIKYKELFIDSKLEENDNLLNLEKNLRNGKGPLDLNEQNENYLNDENIENNKDYLLKKKTKFFTSTQTQNSYCGDLIKPDFSTIENNLRLIKQQNNQDGIFNLILKNIFIS